MQRRTLISIFVAAMLALTSMSIYADQGRGGGKAGDRDQQTARDQDENRAKGHGKDETRDRDMNRDEDRLQTQGSMSVSDKDIYGSELMSRKNATDIASNCSK